MDVLKGIWKWILALGAAGMAAIYFFRKKPAAVNVTAPPKKVTAGDIVKSYEDKRKASNERIDSQSRDDLVSSINASEHKRKG